MRAILAAIILFWITPTFGQEKGIGSCYKERVGEDTEIFTKTLYYPRYKKGDRMLGLFLADNIKIADIDKSIADTLVLFEYSLKVKFVISKHAQMSDISINSKWQNLSTQIMEALIRSSCDWIPGGTEAYLPVWYSGTLHVKLERKRNSFQLTVEVMSDGIGR